VLESVGDAVDPASSGPVRPVSACWVGRVLRDAHIRVHRVRGWLHRIPEALFDARIAAIGTSPFWSANALPTLRERGHGVREICPPFGPLSVDNQPGVASQSAAARPRSLRR
jgi:hypothetical protein